MTFVVNIIIKYWLFGKLCGGDRTRYQAVNAAHIVAATMQKLMHIV